MFFKKYYEEGIFPEEEFVWKYQDPEVKKGKGFCQTTASFCTRFFAFRREKEDKEPNTNESNSHTK
jgi:hypothetical protein